MKKILFVVIFLFSINLYSKSKYIINNYSLPVNISFIMGNNRIKSVKIYSGLVFLFDYSDKDVIKKIDIKLDSGFCMSIIHRDAIDNSNTIIIYKNPSLLGVFGIQLSKDLFFKK